MKTLISTVFLALLGVSLSAQTPVTLKLNLETTVISYKVLRQENEVMDIEFKFDTIASKISSVMFNKETNSAKPAGNDPLEKIMNKMSTYKLIAKISTAGKFIDFVNYKNFKDNVMIVLDSIPATKRDQAKTQAEGLLKESAVKSMVEPLFAYLPETAVKLGDTWETTYFRIASSVSLLAQNSFTLKGIDAKTATVSGKTEIESMPSNEPTPQMSQELKGSMTFDGTLDVSTGLMLKNNSKGHLEGITTMKNNGTEMKMPVAVDSLTETFMLK